MRRDSRCSDRDPRLYYMLDCLHYLDIYINVDIHYIDIYINVDLDIHFVYLFSVCLLLFTVVGYI